MFSGAKTMFRVVDARFCKSLMRCGMEK